MREILFRGKQAWNDEWAESEYPFGTIHCGAVVHDFIPETVGQYTGSTDKNEKKIFEGDIVDFYFFDKGHKNTKTMLIEWRDEGFGMRELYRDYRLADDFSIITEKIFTYRGDIRHGVYTTNNTYFVEVIGNIHDNPELLKGE